MSIRAPTKGCTENSYRKEGGYTLNKTMKLTGRKIIKKCSFKTICLLIVLTFIFSVTAVPFYTAATITEMAPVGVPNEVKGKTVAEVLGMDPVKYFAWLNSHTTDDYYLGTPYMPYDHRNPNGDCAGAYGTLDKKGVPGMNCTGFVWHVLYKATKESGGNTSMIPALGRTQWLNFYQNNNISRKYFSSKQEMLNSGYLDKGDIIWMYVNGEEYISNDYHHVGIYWGDGKSDAFWHSLDAGGNIQGNVQSIITPKKPNINVMYQVLKVSDQCAVTVIKKSANPELTDGDSRFSFKDIQYYFSKGNKPEDFKTTSDNYIGMVKLDENGVASTTEGSRKTLRKLVPGTYYVREHENNVRKASGYGLNPQVYTVTVTPKNTITNPAILYVDDPPEFILNAKIIKKSANPEITDNNECYSVSGAKFNVYKTRVDAENKTNVFRENLVTDDDGIAIVENILPGTYYVREIEAPKGYELSDDIATLVVEADAENIAEVEIKNQPDNDPTSIIIHKNDPDHVEKDEHGNDVNKPIPGVEFEICYYDADPTTTLTLADLGDRAPKRTWVIKTDDDGYAALGNAWKVDGSDDFYYQYNAAGQPFGNPVVPIGCLTLTEKKEAPGYYIDPTVRFARVTKEMADNNALIRFSDTALTNDSIDYPNHETETHVSKKDRTSLKEVPGAELQVIDKEGSVVDSWTSATTPHVIRGLVIGETYTLHEQSPPAGYVTSPDVQFIVKGAEEITTVTMYEDMTEYDFIKVDRNNRALAGATLRVEEVSDNTNKFTEQWVTDGTPHTISGKLVVGKTYKLIEVAAPSGYMLADPITFTVSDEKKTQTVTMKDIGYVSNPVILRKVDAETGNSLEGAIFVVEYYDKVFTDATYSTDYTPVRRWLLKTDSNGEIKLDNNHLVSSYKDPLDNEVTFTNDGFFYSPNDNTLAVLPMGSLKITEVEAPTAKRPDGNTYKYRLDTTPTIRPIVTFPGIGTVYSTATLKNTAEDALTTSVYGEKIWDDNNNENNNRPQAITIDLYKTVNGVKTKVSSMETNAALNWKYEFVGLPLKEEVEGVKYDVMYSVDESEIPRCYVVSHNGNNIVNTELDTSVYVEKLWDDYNDQDGIQPESITVRLYEGLTYTGKYVELSEKNNWHYTFTNLPYYKNGEAVNYQIVEDEVPGYSVIVNYWGSHLLRNNLQCYLLNTHDPEKTSVEVRKEWLDGNDADKLRPTNVKIKLYGYSGNNKVFESSDRTISAASNATDDPNVWSYTFEGLDKYTDKGTLINYVAKEITLINEYNLDEEGNPQQITAQLELQEDGAYACKLENFHRVDRTEYRVFKVWNDEDNRDGLRPDAVTVYLMTVDENGVKSRYIDQDGNEVSGVLQEDNEWTWTFTDLPIKDRNKQYIVYSAEELVPAGYTVSYDSDFANELAIKNSHKERTSVTVNKVWDDANDQDGIQPDSVTVNLLADGVKIDEVELSAANNWSYTFDDLYVNENGTPIKYTVTENGITLPSSYTGEGYTTRYSRIQGTAETGFTYTVTNVHTPTTRDIDVTKVWKDNNDADGIRPDHIEARLSVTSPSNTGIEDKLGYLSEQTNWQYTFKDLPKYYNGTLIRYTVTETPIYISENSNGYTSSISGNMDDGFTITNTHQTERIRVIIDKVWDDDDDSARMRPSTATFEITGYQGEVSTVILSEANNWHYSKTYNKYDNGVVQEPVVKEIALPEGYIGRKVVTVTHPSGSRVTTYQYTWTNTYEPEPTTIPVKKIWADHDNGQDFGVIVELHRRPIGQTVDTFIDYIALTEYNDWQGEFDGVFPRYVDGVECEYYIKEYVLNFNEYFDEYGEYTLSGTDEEFEYRENTSESFDDNYTAEIAGNNIDGYVIVNTHNDFTKMDLPFVKVWEDGDNADGSRPTSIDVVLTGYVGGNAYQGDFDNSTAVISRHAIVKATDGWKYTFTDLPAMCTDTSIVGTVDDYADSYEYADARLIYYTVKEVVPSGYTQTLTMQSRYLHDKDEYYRDLYSGTFKHPQEYLYRYLTIPECRKAKKDHNDFIDWVSHHSVTPSQIAHSGGYRYDMNLGLVNYSPTVKTSVTVNKIWDDANNQDGVRPSSLKVNLLADGVKVKDATLNDTNGWSYTFSNLNANSNGQPITYTVTEDSIPAVEGHNEYEQTNVEIEGNTKDGWSYTFTNRLEPETTHVNVIKQWQDDKNLFGLRPSRLTITLKADGVAVRTYTMTVADEDASAATYQSDVWKYTFDNLPKYKNGVEIEYTVEETLTKKISKYYRLHRTRTTTDSNGIKTFIFNNRHNSATFSLRKTGINNSLLTGAVFELFFIDGTPLNIRQLVNERYLYAPNDSSATNRITLGFGVADITNLPPDAVIVAREVVAPEGYAPYSEDIIIDIPQAIKDNNITVSNSGVYTLPDVTVNNSRIVMPATGGFGDYAFYLLAGASLIGSLIFLFLKKRKDDEA